MSDILISHIYKSYGEKAVLRDFSAVIKAGETTALTAPSGAGKTTLLRLLMGLEKPDSGSIEGLEGLRISAVFQEDRLCGRLSAEDNIRLVNPSLSLESVTEALKSVGLEESAFQKTQELSGGMRRRVAILRALMAPYDFLMLDEPFRGLDDRTKEIVMSDTLKRCRGRTVLFVTHDLSELEPMEAVNRIEMPQL